MGSLVALVVWATQKEKSRYIRFQAVQALAFDMVIMLVTVLVIFMMAIFLVFIFGVGALLLLLFASSSANNDPGALMAPVLLFGMMPTFIGLLAVPVSGLVFMVRLIAVINVFQGKDFRYPWLGNRVAQFLNS